MKLFLIAILWAGFASAEGIDSAQDANQAKFTTPVVEIYTETNALDGSTDVFSKYIWVPVISNATPIICMKPTESRLVQCFYREEHSDVTHVVDILPRGEKI